MESRSTMEFRESIERDARPPPITEDRGEEEHFSTALG